jgi:hypothetical protein
MEGNQPPGTQCTPPEDNNTPPNNNNPNGGNTGTVVLGAQASVGNSQSVPAAPAAAGAQVPTVIDSGLPGNERQTQPLLPLLALLFGFGATVVALTRRKATA